MDGVIVDSEPLHERAFREVFEEIGFGHTHGIDFSAYYGKSDLVVYRPALGFWFINRSSTNFADSLTFAWGQDLGTGA